MRDLKRNQRKLYYATFIEKQPIYKKDDNGNVVYLDGEPVETGQYTNGYSNPKELEISTSANKGSSEIDLFGTSLQYDRTLSTTNIDLDIDEYSVLWVDCKPVIKEDGTTDTPFDYKVKKVAPSLNQLVIAISKVRENG